MREKHSWEQSRAGRDNETQVIQMKRANEGQREGKTRLLKIQHETPDLTSLTRKKDPNTFLSAASVVFSPAAFDSRVIAFVTVSSTFSFCSRSVKLHLAQVRCRTPVSSFPDTLFPVHRSTRMYLQPSIFCLFPLLSHLGSTRVPPIHARTHAYLPPL